MTLPRVTFGIFKFMTTAPLNKLTTEHQKVDMSWFSVKAERESLQQNPRIRFYTHCTLTVSLDCEQSLFLSDNEREARESGNRARSASERKSTVSQEYDKR